MNQQAEEKIKAAGEEAEAILKENQDKVAKEQKDLEELREKKSGVIRSLEEITADIQRLSDKIKASGK